MKILKGYDTKGSVYDAGDHIVREIKKSYLKEATKIFRIYQKSQFLKANIVETKFKKENNVFHHKKHLISYPFEWTANMFKDATLNQLNLFIELSKLGLTLKDALPNNVLFDFTKPVFVDFFSIIPIDKLPEEHWLTENRKGNDDIRFDIFERMFFPFNLIPLTALAKKDNLTARVLLFKKICNCNPVPPNWNDVYPIFGYRGFGIVYSANKTLELILNKQKCKPALNHQKLRWLIRSVREKKEYFLEFARRMYQFIESLDVTPKRSAYVAYYKTKNEDFNIKNRLTWQNKQKNVFKIIKKERPKRVLDIGANTGWFSLMAEKLGSEVIATDIDESSIDTLYLRAKEQNLKILPLFLSFDDFDRKIYGISPNETSQNSVGNEPLYQAASERLTSDLVLCLGLLHHLILGRGKSFDEVLSVLSKLCKKTLVLEFVDLDDKLVKNEPSFFANIKKFNKQNYNLDKVKSAGRKYFKHVEILESNPETRKLLIFKR
jgi:SAM-dependent methyltransferase